MERHSESLCVKCSKRAEDFYLQVPTVVARIVDRESDATTITTWYQKQGSRITNLCFGCYFAVRWKSAGWRFLSALFMGTGLSYYLIAGFLDGRGLSQVPNWQVVLVAVLVYPGLILSVLSVLHTPFADRFFVRDDVIRVAIRWANARTSGMHEVSGLALLSQQDWSRLEGKGTRRTRSELADLNRSDLGRSGLNEGPELRETLRWQESRSLDIDRLIT